MNLDDEELAHNTPEARAARVNAPRWTEGLELGTYPRPVPAEFAAWLDSVSRPPFPPRGLVLHGPVGTGKTGLGAAALRVLARAGVGSTFQWNLVTSPGVRAAAGAPGEPPAPCWFEHFSRLLARNRRERWDEEGWFEQLEARVSVLMLDDVGVDVGTPFRESFFLRHVEWSYGAGRSLLLTLNPPPGAWRKLLGERAADRLLDQRWFTHVRLGGASLR